ncbi:winged helix-turn-helix domain-containing protein [Haloarcula sp. JP-L23]|uniref:winged helix-turn-helix domain-containing protein n=1 Tax=Haloarcula sp. JP-L23 TaxID=2716717 RepID=UPI00140EF705|nr:winged helix-turn-helix transcriptional regulator [Haloarcula sp. JP-L23]
MAGLSLSIEGSLDPTARLSVGPDGLTSPRAITRDLWRPDRHDLAGALCRALRQLVGDEPRTSRRATLVEEYDVTALQETYHGPSDEYHYARLAAYALESDLEQLRFLQVTRQLGGSTSIGIASSLADVRDGPIQILRAADGPTPTVVVELTRFRDLKSNQRSALLSYLLDLAAGVDVRLVATPLDQRCLLDTHREELPASVTADAESRHGGSGPVATRTAQRRETARELLADRGEDHPDWRRLKALYDAPQEAASYDWLEANTLADFPSRDALKQWVRRLSNHELLEAYGPPQDRHVRLLPTGYALLDELPSIAVAPSDGGAGRTDGHSKAVPTGQTDTAATVSDPPNTSDSTVYSPPAHEGGKDRPAGEAATATTGGSDITSRSTLDVGFLDGFEHDAAVSMAQPGEIALCDRPVATSGDSRQAEWSYLRENDEAVVRVEASGWAALTMTRLCAALLSDPAFQQVLTVNRLAGGPEKSGLDGLPVSNPYVLRSGACFGYLKNTDATAKNFRHRLRQARNELLTMTEAIEFGADSDLDAISELARKAHGLAGVATRLYDMLDIDVTRVVEVPKSVVADVDRRRHLVKMLATQTTVSSRYGVYSAHRVLYEERPEKREQLLGAPDVDAADPVGDVVGSWVLVGEDVGSLRDPLENLENHLVLQTDETNFAPFTLSLDIVDGNRRSAYATALARQSRLKNMDTTRQTVSILRAVSSDVFAAAKAISRLGSEDNGRNLGLYDVRSALAFLNPEELVPDIGPRTVSQVIQLLLDVEDPLSTSEVADAVGVTPQTIANNDEHFSDLEAAGLLEREDLGAGKATQWRISLPFETERRQSSGPTPTICVDAPASEIDSDRPVAALAECLFRAPHRDIDYGSDRFLTATTPGGDLGPLLTVQPELLPICRLVVELLGWTIQEVPIAGLIDSQSPSNSTDSQPLAAGSPTLSFGCDPTPATTQCALSVVD